MEAVYVYMQRALAAAASLLAYPPAEALVALRPPASRVPSDASGFVEWMRNDTALPAATWASVVH